VSRTIIILFVCFAPCGFWANAQNDPLTVSDAVESAFSRHPAVSAFDAGVSATRANMQQAAYRPNPEASAGLGYKDTETDSGYALDVGLAFPVERSGKREARIGMAESDIRIAEADVQQLRRDIELQIRSLSYEYLVASADSVIASEIAERSRSMIDLLKQRPAAGPIILLELRVIEGSLVEFQMSALEYAAQRDAARSSLNVLLGRSENDPLNLTEDLATPAVQYSMSELVDNLEKSPMLIKRLAEIERANYETQAATLEAKPDLEVGPYFSREDAGDVETTVGLAVTFPLSWRNRNQGGIAAAKAHVAKAEAELDMEKLNVRIELAQRLKRYESAVARVYAIPESLVESLHDSADLADRQYRLGAIPVQLFLDMQREFINVQRLRHNALLEALKMEAELQWLAGSATGENQP